MHMRKARINQRRKEEQTMNDDEETFYCIIYSSYTDIEITKLLALSLLADRILQ